VVDCGTCTDCLKVCPGLGIGKEAGENGGIASLKTGWGRILETWEGFAASEEIRHRGSSGGAASAIALYLIEKGGCGQLVHTGSDDGCAWKNRTVFSRSREELLGRIGSRYAPASPCDGLGAVLNAGTPSVFIGKPCDVQGVRKAELIRPELRKKIRLAISLFCAGTPPTAALLRLMESLHVPIEQVTGVRYRGRGWPGTFAVWTNGSDKPAVEIPYLEAWGFLQKYRPNRCYLCPDGTGEFADISCGDAWHRKPADGNQGYSLILVRTGWGREIFSKAMQAGYIKATQVDPRVLPLSQPGFPEKRGAIWGRLLVMKMFGIPTPKYDGWPLFECWMKLPAKEKARSILGTGKRIVQRKYYRPHNSAAGKGRRLN
jgi:coenzyme F420 hydrogenase subunit beta